MNKIKTIGIDFDLTLVDTAFGAEGWFDYLNKMSKNKLDKQKFLELQVIPMFMQV
jgi:FMN phosphatase YigB (HAD superfamily)